MRVGRGYYLENAVINALVARHVARGLMLLILEPGCDLRWLEDATTRENANSCASRHYGRLNAPRVTVKSDVNLVRCGAAFIFRDCAEGFL
ncbi:hypothetical protein CEXT_175161 [Caerostris extrusa]|uniref:Uncharacterized protein n=1 Tax=Caerostris extrusa TaxID=172846 RepID=A0AAV4XM68_CAEEX|nr:hypothetical protein CEXT_175161 [Caerostris extrusa]